MCSKMKKFNHLTLCLEIIGCNQKCKHCYIPDNKNKFKSLNDVKHILDKYSEVLSITKNPRIYLHDEPTLYPEIIELLAYAAKKGIKHVPSLSTNGIGFVKRDNWKDIISAFVDNGVKGLNMSLFGYKEYHDKFAGFKGSYNIIREAAKRAKTLGLWIHWNLFLTKDNIDQMIELYKELPDKSKVLFIPGSTNKWMEWDNIHITDKEINLIPKDTEKYFMWQKLPQYKTLYIKTEAEWIDMCLNGEDMKEYLEDEEDSNYKSMCLIEKNYNLYDMSYNQVFKVGNILKDSLKEIYLNEKQSKGLTEFNNSNPAILAKKYGDKNNKRVHYFENIMQIWLLKHLNISEGL